MLSKSNKFWRALVPLTSSSTPPTSHPALSPLSLPISPNSFSLSSFRLISSHLQNQSQGKSRASSGKTSSPSQQQLHLDKSAPISQEAGTLRSAEPSKASMKEEMKEASQKAQKGEIPESKMATQGEKRGKGEEREGRSQAKGITGGEMRSQGLGMGLNQGYGLDPKKEQTQERSFSTSSSLNSKKEKESSSAAPGKGTDMPEVTPEVVVDRGPGIGNPYIVDSGIYGTRDFGKENSSSSSSSSSPSSSRDPSSSSSKMEAANQSGNAAAKHAAQAGKEAGKDFGSAGKEAGKAARELGKAGKEAGKEGKKAFQESVERKDAQPIKTVISKLGDSLKEGWRSMMGQGGSSQPPRHV